ncbi:unnamed protein product [Rhodiola kirilowii]
MAKETAPGARKQAAHPPYLQMITEALTTLKERTGSSVPAMVKFLEQKYGPSLPENFRKMLTMQLKKLVESERLVKVKNSFKVAAEKPKPKSIPAATSKKEKKAASSNKDNKAKSKAAGPSKSGKGTGESDNKEKKSQNAKVSEAKKVVKKAMKTKRLSLVKSPDAVKNKKKAAAGAAKEKSKKVVKKKAMKTKRLSLVKSPDAVKNKKKAAAGAAKEKSKKAVKSDNAPGKSTKKKTTAAAGKKQ